MVSMKHWEAIGPASGPTALGNGIALGDKLWSIGHDTEGRLVFCEECDGYFSRTFDSKAQAIEALREAIAWIESQP